MKKFMVFTLLALTTVSAFAQSEVRVHRERGRIVEREASRPMIVVDGREIVRVVVRDGDRDLGMRVRQLEMAVRDMQDRIYELEAEERRESYSRVYCDLTARNQFFTAEGRDRAEAESAVLERCSRAVGAFWCERRNLVCR